MQANVETKTKKKVEECEAITPLRRPNYYYGRLLGARDFRGEQEYFRDKLRLHNRCLHGYGVICGLRVKPVPQEEECPPGENGRPGLERKKREIEEAIAASRDEAEKRKALTALEELRREIDALGKRDCNPPPQPRPLVEIGCGMALDCLGNELTVDRPRRVDIWKLLSEDDRRGWSQGGQTVYLSLCYCEQPEEPHRPLVFQECGFTAECQYNWTRESVRVVATLKPPKADDRCDSCCVPCCGEDHGSEDCGAPTGLDCCLLIAAVHGVKPDRAVHPEQIDYTLQRPLTRYVTTKVTSISWVHGGIYSREQIDALMGTEDEKGGLVVKFSRGVRVSTVKNGVFEVWRIYGGGGGHADIKLVDTEYVDLPASGYVDQVKFRNTTHESLSWGDRLLIQVRTSFLLDHCCRAVDGDHIGGRVPVLKEYYDLNKEQLHDFDECPWPPARPGPWYSGNGSEGGDFISWIYHKDRDYKGPR